MNIKNYKEIISKVGPCLALIILIIVFSIASDKFMVYANVMNILKQSSINALISAGMLIVLITAGIDLSVGAICALCTCVMGIAFKSGITNTFLLIVICLFAGILAGGFNGLLLVKFRLPHPFISTLGTQNIFRGLAVFITAATPISGFPEGVTELGSSTINSFPLSFISVLVLFGVIHLFLTQTSLGRQIYCVGGNPEAARLSGIKSDQVLVICYMISGFMASLAGLVLIGRVGTAFPLAGNAYETDAIAACIIGGASFFGGKGTIWGTLIGAILIAVIRNGLNLVGISTSVQQIIIGAVIILAVFIDVTRERMEEKSKKLSAQ